MRNPVSEPILKKRVQSVFAGMSGGLLLFFLFMPAGAFGYPLPFDPFVAPESFGCKSLIVPGAELLPHDPVIDSRILPGWKTVLMKDGKNATIETLVIKGSAIGHKKDASGRIDPAPLVVIPAGGLVYDATVRKTHLPVGDRGVIFGKTAELLDKKISEETCRNFSVLAGRSFPVGDSIITYLAPGPKGGPLVLWRTVDGVSIRPQALSEYPAGQIPAKTPTRIFGVYTHAGQIAEYTSFSAPMIVFEKWKIDGKVKKVTTAMEWFPHFLMVPVSCPIGHHIGLMVTNDVPIVLEPGKNFAAFGGYLKMRIETIDQKNGDIFFSLNGRSYTGHHGMDGLFGSGRAIDGIKNTEAILNKIRAGS